ncbi:MAG: hypothetical protein K2L26_03030 [Duncaniella sp.]|nr:hypothetical protein [Duncaniella sp.]
MPRKIIIAAVLASVCASGASAQFFSLDAGTDGVNLHVSNFFPFAAPVVVAPPVPVVVPYRPGVVVSAPKPRHVRKAVRRATRRYVREVGASLLPSVVIAPGAVVAGYGYYDDDDYEDYMEDVYKARKKAYKKYKKEMKKYYKHHHKHHKHHHHDDDDD